MVGKNVDPASRCARNLVKASNAIPPWLVNVDGVPNVPEEPFRRDRDAAGVNSLFNYGYAICAGTLARVLVSAGLHPALGLHHSNRGNAFCLADDLMEPLRPLVDARVRELHWAGHFGTRPGEFKARLLELLTCSEVETGSAEQVR